MLIIDDLLIGLPVKALIFIMQKIRDQVNTELTKAQRQKLITLDDELKRAIIDREQYIKEGLEVIKQAKRRKTKL